MASAAGKGSTYSYPESEANGWTDTCVDGEYQSPVDLPTNMKAEVHAPINYRNYFNGHFNKHFKGTLRNTGTSGKKSRISKPSIPLSNSKLYSIQSKCLYLF